MLVMVADQNIIIGLAFVNNKLLRKMCCLLWVPCVEKGAMRGLSVLLGNGYERSHVLWVDYMSNSDY